MRTFNIRDKSQNNGGGIPTEMLISSATESHREQKLASNNCYYNILKPRNKIYNKIRLSCCSNIDGILMNIILEKNHSK